MVKCHKNSKDNENKKGILVWVVGVVRKVRKRRREEEEGSEKRGREEEVR